MTIYQWDVKTITGEEVSLEQYRNKVLLIVNTASKCGFTPQYKELQELYEEFKDNGLVVLSFPCNQFMSQEPGDEKEIQSFCELNYGVDFPMFAKVDVNGENASPLYKYLTDKAPGLLGSKAVKWNFTKFLVNRKGEVLERFSPNTNPKELKPKIEKLLKEA